MTRSQYKPRAGADVVTADILSIYESLGPECKAAVDEIAQRLIDKCQPSGERKGLHGLGKQGAIELVGKLLILLDGAEVGK